VICEDIERSGRDTFNALKLEKQLAAAGVPLFATDEPIDITGINATTVLVRRVKQGVAEWFRLQIKEKAWKGLREHSLAGWNIGPAPYGYAAERIAHPVPFKAAQGRTKTRLILDPDRASAVADIFTWRVENKLGMNTITHRLNADPGRYPPPGEAGWTVPTVHAVLHNPKYTGHMVFGRRRHRQLAPRSEWLWSPEPTHPAIITRAMWDAAQAMGAEHASSRDGDGPSAHPAARRTYLLRSRVRCRACKKRMCGIVRRSGAGSVTVREYVYYGCHHDPGNPRHAAAHPGHPRAVSIREDHLLTAIAEFFATRVFGPDRAALLAQTLPASAAEDAARRDRQAAAIGKKLRQIDAAENAHAREIEQLAQADAPAAAITALRTRIIARFTELENERTQLNHELADLEKATPEAGDPALLDRLPVLGDILTGAPIRLHQQLYDTFGLHAVYKYETRQVTIYATITTSTPQALAAILTEHHRPHQHAGPATPDCTDVSVSARPPICAPNHRRDRLTRPGPGRAPGPGRVPGS
jgi:site-specific DNA recombinase